LTSILPVTFNLSSLHFPTRDENQERTLQNPTSSEELEALCPCRLQVSTIPKKYADIPPLVARPAAFLEEDPRRPEQYRTILGTRSCSGG
jgi:hypothetical protein